MIASCSTGRSGVAETCTLDYVARFLRRKKLTTDAGSEQRDLLDDRAPQRVELTPGVTCSVQLTIESVHDGADHLDVAVSEVGFLVRPAEGSC